MTFRTMRGLGVPLSLLAVLAVSVVVSAGDFELKQEKDVLLLNSKNFHHVVSTHEIVLVLFHVPWDNAYRAMLPEFEKAATQLEKDTPSVLLARLDTSLYPDVAKEVDIRGDAAQLIYYHLSKPYIFEEFGTADKLIKSLKDRSQLMYTPPRPHPELVDELSQHEFKTTLKKYDFAVVAFYRENCPSCVRLLVEYETAVVNLTDLPKARFFKTNLDTAPELVKEYEIAEVPILKIFRNGKMFNFKPEHKLVAAIIDYVKKQILPPYKEFDQLEKAEGWARSYPNKAAVIGVFEKTSGANFELFTDIANYFREDYNFAWVKKVPSNESPLSLRPVAIVDGSIAVYPPFRHLSHEDKKIHVYAGSQSFEELSKYIVKKTVPHVGQRTMRNKDTTYAVRPLLIGYIDVDWSKGNDDDTTFHRNKIAQVVGVSKEMTFAISDKREFKHELSRMGLSNYNEELLVGIIGTNGEYYPGPVVEMMNLKILTDFAQDYMKNKLKPYHRTQSPPTSDDSDDYPVKTVVGATFRKLVLRHDKPVALLAHRPNCPLCRTALNLLHDMGEEKSLYPGLVYAAMDFVANDPPARFTPKTYPTLFAVPPGDKKKPIVYPSRNFTREAVMEFLDLHIANYRHKDEL
ncbi:Protein disulfide-isomerase A4 [Hypsibius exemplaris]|uniref:protein disulfide-isomerase n=1 Tax=Hypsibius exemplaris TaxID=2072580 RepID=A0A1W0WMP8_HYPEX|nr:Protein disulfide-isomerase A4 [Hypsibius exemplaris]